MKKEIYDGLVSKLATLAPWFAKSIIDMAIERAGKRDYMEMTPIEMLGVIKNDINPRIANWHSGFSSLLTAGAGVLFTDSRDRIVYINPFLKKIIARRLLTPDAREARRRGEDLILDGDLFEILRELGIVKRTADVETVEVREFYCEELGKHLNVSTVSLAGPWRDAALGASPGLCCIVQDITLREAIETEVQRFFKVLSSTKTALERKNEELRRMQDELVQRAYTSGMVESVTTVLHNIGNAINSVSIRIGEICIDSTSPIPAQLKKVSQVLEHNRASLDDYLRRDEKGVLVLPFLTEVIRELEASLGRVNDNALVVRDAADHISEIISLQQGYAGVQIRAEPVDWNRVILDALMMQAEAIDRRDITVTTALGELPPLETQKSSLHQLCLNLIKNAIEAIELGTRTDPAARRSINIVTEVEGRGGQAFATGRFSDTGIGIPRSNKKKLFMFGFSTKRRGSGFGLHSCANYVQSMNGAIAIESQGQGRGATVTVSFPREGGRGARRA